ncbi:GPO family capsid scaffolding protein [Sphingopyxis yananensis]|uniref:GPO family capsid scaffolding protein n=1 Tax=Sphingopyxis yananensis TaxID=2886687 RepID=UPI001D121F82|nr:GPO family capsid scaffolding protein [Sphingopyxis yananensis]MCC2602761.1 GPO family capsid scaffolding protein [Sphingopyxis yananensis]
MARTKFFRVAVEGPTIDGRNIERKHLEQMAASYDPATYTARLNVEHLRGYSPNPPFNAYGSIAEVKTEEITLNIGGKDQKKLALYASFDVNDQAKQLTADDQKIFSSVEIQPNFAQTNKAYLVGLALTDSPASLATEALKFSARDDAKKDHLLAVDDAGFIMEFADAGSSDEELKQAGSFLKKLFSGMMAGGSETVITPAPAPAAPPVPVDQFAQLASAMEQGFTKLTELQASVAAKQDARIAALSQELSGLKGDLEKAPVRKFTARPAATGGGDRILADC